MNSKTKNKQKTIKKIHNKNFHNNQTEQAKALYYSIIVLQLYLRDFLCLRPVCSLPLLFSAESAPSMRSANADVARFGSGGSDDVARRLDETSERRGDAARGELVSEVVVSESRQQN